MPITLSAARAHPMPAAFEQIFCTDAAPGTEPELPDFLGRIQDYGSRLRFCRNEIIFNQGDAAEQVFRILSGTVRLCRYTPDGRRSIMEFAGTGDLIGLVDEGRQPLSAEAVSDVTMISYPSACFDKLAADHPVLRQKLRISPAGGQPSLKEAGAAPRAAASRLASFLLRMADRQDLSDGDRLDLVMSRQDVADHLDLTVEIVSRTINALRSAGAILVPNSNQLILREMDGLRALASGI